MKYFVTDGYLSAYSGDFGIKNLLDLKNQVTVDPNQDRYYYNQMMWAARNFTFNMDNFKQYNYPIEYLRSIEKLQYLRYNTVEYIATDRIGDLTGPAMSGATGRNVVGVPMKSKSFVRGTFCNEAYSQKLKNEGFADQKDITINDAFINVGYAWSGVPLSQQYSTTSACYANDNALWQSQYKIINNSNPYILLYEGYGCNPFYITGKFNVSYMASSYTETRLIYYGSSQQDDVKIYPKGISSVNEVLDFTGHYISDFRHNIAHPNGMTSMDCSHTSHYNGFTWMPDISLNSHHGNLSYMISDLYKREESTNYGSSGTDVDNYVYQTEISINLTQTLSQKWPQQLLMPTLSNCFYTIYTPDGVFYDHGLMPTINNDEFNFICNPLFSSKIKLSNNRGLLHVGGFFPYNRQVIFTEDNTNISTSIGNSWTDKHPSNAPTSDPTLCKAYFTGKIILASGGIYKGKRIPFKQEASKYIYIFDNSSMSFKVIGELPVPLFGCSTFTINENEFLIIGGISTCPTAKTDWDNITPEKSVYKITLNNDLTLKSINKLQDLKYGHFFAGITTVNNRLFIVSGTNYELYDINLGSLKSGQIKTPRYGCYIQKYITGEGYDQYALIGGWKYTTIGGITSICPIRYIGLTNDQKSQYDRSLIDGDSNRDYDRHVTRLEPESLTGYYMPDIDFVTDNNFSLSYESADDIRRAVYEDGTYSSYPKNITWNDKIEIVSGLETIKDNIPSFTVDTKIVSNYGDKVTFTLPPASFYSPGDKVTVTYIDNFTSNYENQIYATYIDITQSDNYSTYSSNVVRKETHIYRLYKGDGSVIYEKQITVDTMHEQLSLTTSVKYPAIASEYVLTPTFSSSYDGDVYLVKDVHPEVKILLGKDKSGIGITMKTEVDSAPYLGWHLRIVRPNGVIREISNTYVSNIIIPTTFKVIAPSNYNESNGIVVGTEFTLQFDCPSGQLKNALFVNLNDSNAPKIPITIGTPFKYTPSTPGYVTYHVECKTLDGIKTISSDSIVLNTFDSTTVELEVISPANYTGSTLTIGTVITLRLNCSNPEIKTGQITIMCAGKDNIYLDVNTNTLFTYTLQETSYFSGSVISAYGNSINAANQVSFNVATLECSLNLISPTGYNGETVNNGTVFTLQLDCTDPAIKTGKICIQIAPDPNVYMDVNVGVPFTYTPPDYKTAWVYGEIISNGNTVASNGSSIELSVTGPEIKLNLKIISPTDYIDTIDDVLNGTIYTIQCDAIIPDGMSINGPLKLTGNTTTLTNWISGIDGGDREISVGVPFTFSPADNNKIELWVEGTDNFSNSIYSSTSIYLQTVAVQEPKLRLNVISPAGYINSSVTDLLNGTEITFNSAIRLPSNTSFTDLAFKGSKNDGSTIMLTNLPSITLGTPFTYTPENNLYSDFWLEAKSGDGSIIKSNDVQYFMMDAT